jgi:hypothetical protein
MQGTSPRPPSLLNRSHSILIEPEPRLHSFLEAFSSREPEIHFARKRFAPYFDAFSLREPVATSLENALPQTPKRRRSVLATPSGNGLTFACRFAAI